MELFSHELKALFREGFLLGIYRWWVLHTLNSTEKRILLASFSQSLYFTPKGVREAERLIRCGAVVAGDTNNPKT
jgi:hypothetical protein